MSKSPGKIFQTRSLTALWLGQVISMSGDSIYQIGLLWLALELSASKTVTGLVAMAAYLPAMLLALPAGAIADRANRRTVMLSADLFRMLVVLVIPVAASLNILSPALLAADAFLVAIAAAFFNPARDAVIPQIVPPSGLLRANSLIQTSWQFALLIGPAFAGLFLQLFGLVHLFTVDSAAYLFSFACILLIRPRPLATEPRKKGLSVHELLEGFVYVRKSRILFPLLLITIADNLFIMGPAMVGTPVFVKEVIHGQADDYALIMGCYAVGMLIGTAWLVTQGARFGKGKILLWGMVADGFTFVPYFFARSLESMAIVTIIHSLAIPLLTVSRASLIQEITPERLTGRVFALISLAVTGMTAISAGITGLVLEWISPPALFLIIGTVAGLCGVAGFVFAKEINRFH